MALAMAACTFPPPPRQPPVAGASAGGSASLAGTSWMLASLNGQAPVANTTVTLNFSANAVSGSDGCNNYSGAYSVDGSNITFGPLRTTLMACPEPIMQQAAAYQQALANAKTFKIEGGQLMLMDGSGVALATFAPQDTGLAGTNWLVTGYNNGKQAVVSVIIDTQLTANFGADGQLSGSAGCNNYTGSYKTDSSNITIGPLAATRKLCQPDEVMQQEAQYLAALETAATYRIDGNRMELRTAEGALATTFERAE
jgi:heat shock protein HslJ